MDNYQFVISDKREEIRMLEHRLETLKKQEINQSLNIQDIYNQTLDISDEILNLNETIEDIVNWKKFRSDLLKRSVLPAVIEAGILYVGISIFIGNFYSAGNMVVPLIMIGDKVWDYFWEISDRKQLVRKTNISDLNMKITWQEIKIEKKNKDLDFVKGELKKTANQISEMRIEINSSKMQLHRLIDDRNKMISMMFEKDAATYSDSIDEPITHDENQIGNCKIYKK